MNKVNCSRDLTEKELEWIDEIIRGNPVWSDAILINTCVSHEEVSQDISRIYLTSPSPQINHLQGTFGYIGMLAIVTDDQFGITVTLDQHDGYLSLLYISFLDLSGAEARPRPVAWVETAHEYTSM